MRIARYTVDGTTSWGAVENDLVRPLVGDFHDWAGAITADGSGAAPFGPPPLALSDITLLAPVTATSRVLAVGMNYSSHTEKADSPEREHHTLGYSVPLETVINPDDILRYPPLTNRLDYEIELVAVMGSPLRPGADSLRSVLGYTIGCDTSARDLGRPPGFPIDLFSMKGMDRTRPIGPWIVTRDELGHGQPHLQMTTRVNGEIRQDDSTAKMIWSVTRCVEWLETRTALKAGDTVWTGTCGGTAVEQDNRNPGTGPWLLPGDSLELEIERIGTLRSIVGERA